MDYFHELYSSLRKTRILRQWSLLSPLPGNFCPSEAWSKRKSKPSLESTYHWSVRHANNIKGLMIYRNIHTSPDNFLSPQESMDHFSLGKPNQNKNKTSHTFQFCSQNISKRCFLGRKKKTRRHVFCSMWITKPWISVFYHHSMSCRWYLSSSQLLDSSNRDMFQNPPGDGFQ